MAGGVLFHNANSIDFIAPVLVDALHMVGELFTFDVAALEPTAAGRFTLSCNSCIRVLLLIGG
ncbi:MAG: hypothetical protein ACREDR_03040 [Blastocatellia bacterium]